MIRTELPLPGPLPMARSEAMTRAVNVTPLHAGLEAKAPDAFLERASHLTPFTPSSVGTSSSPHAPVDVLVIGGGVAGLSAAQEVMRSGRSVQVLEALGRVGGRAWTDTVTFPMPVDLGGAWMHGPERNTLMGVLADQHVPLVETNWGATRIGPGFASPEFERAIEKETEDFDARLIKAMSEGDDRAAVEFMAPGPAGAAVSLIKGPLEAATDLESVSPELALFRSGPNDKLAPGGMGKSLIDHLERGVPVQLGTAVKKVTQGPTGVEVLTASGETLHARKVLITVSTGVLASGKIAFEPQLPEWKRDAIGGLPMGLMNKVIVQFEPGRNPFGDLKPNTWVNYLPDAGDKDGRGMGFLTMDHDVVVGFVGGSQAWELEGAPGKALDYAMKKMEHLSGDKLDDAVMKSEVTHFGDTSEFLGAYAYAKPGFAHAREKLAEPVGNLHFAGEAVAQLEEVGSLAGAYNTGRAEARKMVDQLSQEDGVDWSFNRQAK